MPVAPPEYCTKLSVPRTVRMTNPYSMRASRRKRATSPLQVGLSRAGQFIHAPSDGRPNSPQDAS